MRAGRGHRWRGLLVGSGLVAVAALGTWGFWLEPAALRNHRHVLELPGFTGPCSGLEVVALVDLHTGSPHNGLAQLARLVERVNALEPDLVLLAGDYVIHGVVGGRFVSPEESAALLGRLEAAAGVYAVLGNHDWWLDGGRVRRALEAAGIPVLEDEARRTAAGGCAFWVVGVGDYWEGDHDVDKALAAVGDDAPVIAFTHNPDLFPRLPARFDLTVAGHTHGGQVDLPLVGRPIVPSRFGQRYAAGHVVEDGRHLFVTTGVGTSILPLRLRVPPEISVLELRGAVARS